MVKKYLENPQGFFKTLSTTVRVILVDNSNSEDSYVVKSLAYNIYFDVKENLSPKSQCSVSYHYNTLKNQESKHRGSSSPSTSTSTS
jgi:hypothetical protein